jgi:hypothetical protein
MKDILVTFDDIKSRNRPLLLTTLVEEVINTNQNLSAGEWSLTKNDIAMSVVYRSISDVKLSDSLNYSGIVVVIINSQMSQEIYDGLNIITRMSTSDKPIPILFISNFAHPSITTFVQIKICNNFNDIKWFLNTVLTIPQYKSNIAHSNPQTPSLGTSPWQWSLGAVDETKLVFLFENAQLPLDNWDHRNQMRIINYSIKKYGYDNSIDEDSWLCRNWKKYIFNVMNLEYNSYWHYSLIRFWVEIIHKFGKYDTDKAETTKLSGFDKMYASSQLAWLRNPNLWQYYYSKDVLFSPHARECWVSPNLRNI